MLKWLSGKRVFPVALIMIFAVISAVCLIFQGDDFIWYFVYDIEEMSDFQIPNGRYFTNCLTHLMVKFPLIRYVIFTGAMSALIIVITHLIDFEKKSGVMKYGLSFSLLALLPTSVYSNTMTWISGFTNYAISILLTLVYVFYCFKIMFDRTYIPSKIWLVFASVLGLAGALCVENISIYNILFGIFSIIIIFKLRKRFFASNILYLITSVVGFIIMMSADAYGEIFKKEQNDSLGMRHVEISFSDIFMQIYRSTAPEYARQFFVIHILIAFCFLYLYYKADKNDWNTAKKRYGKICINITALYAVYSLWINCFEDLVEFDISMRLKALEAAFVFVYLISLIYLAFTLLEADKFLRFTIYLISTIIVVAPFAVVNPVSPRCFFADAVFWILLSGELFFACFEKFVFFRSNELRNLICIASLLAGIFICNMNISNKIWNNIRIDYIREQVNENKKTIEIIELPYDNLVLDDLSKDGIFDCYFLDDIGYTELLFKYYDIDVDKYSFKFLYISTVDYNMR